MVSYQELLEIATKDRHFHVSIRKKYFVISFKHSPFHITIFQDQWDDYQNLTGMNYHLFHVSSDIVVDRCSSYFWIDRDTLRIMEIPPKYFQYGQSEYSIYASTRFPCPFNEIKPILKRFQTFLNKI